jgi:hypothetical protein
MRYGPLIKKLRVVAKDFWVAATFLRDWRASIKRVRSFDRLLVVYWRKEFVLWVLGFRIEWLISTMEFLL